MPFIVSGPQVVQPGREESALVSVVDVTATALEVAGVPPRAYLAFDGVSLVPYLQAPGLPPLRTHVFTERFDGTEQETSGFLAVRDVQHKYVRRHLPSGGALEELYDLVADPFETSDLTSGALTAAQQVALQSLRAVADGLRHPAPMVETYGSTTCAGSAGAPTLQVGGTPAIGAAYFPGVVSAPAGAPAFLFLGVSRTEWLGFPLPLDLTSFGGAAGCLLLASGETWIEGTTDAAGALAIPIGIPVEPWLLGTSAHHTWVILDPLAAVFPYTTSDAATVTIGE